MKFSVQVKPGAKQDRIEKIDETHFRVWVKAPPQDGKANLAAIKILSQYFDKPKSTIRLLHGAGSKTKIFELI